MTNGQAELVMSKVSRFLASKGESGFKADTGAEAFLPVNAWGVIATTPQSAVRKVMEDVGWYEVVYIGQHDAVQICIHKQ